MDDQEIGSIFQTQKCAFGFLKLRFLAQIFWILVNLWRQMHQMINIGTKHFGNGKI